MPKHQPNDNDPYDMRDGDTLTLELRGLRERAAVRVRAATGGSIVGVARAIEFVVVLTGWLVLPVWPLVATAVARDSSYVRRYLSTLIRMTAHIRATWRGRAVSRMVAQRLMPPALRIPERISGHCTHCGNCCLDRSCVFLTFDEQGGSRCRIYGGKVWNWLTCGQYPVDGAEIALYRCPSFTALRDSEADRRRVVPIAAAERSSADRNVR